MRTLVVEDAPRLANWIAEGLRDQGIAVDIAYDGNEAASRLNLNAYDVVVLDRDLPGIHGDTLCQMITESDEPAMILMLTAAGEPDERVAGLALGADDYLAKPFDPEELVLRVEAILRRAAQAPPAARQIKLGRCVFDTGRGELYADGAAVRLTESEAHLLRVLARAAHAAVDRLDLVGANTDAGGRAVDIQVTRLRRKIEADPANPRYLRTVRGRGYMLTPD
jgi:two-component system, OmpR family, phosphate regulon response regulator OmpR